MAIVPMQKVAILAHRSHKEALLQKLQEAGVLEIGESKQPPSVDHTEVNFREAELLFAIDVLKEIASKQTLKAADRVPTPEEIIAAAQRTDVRGIVDRLHVLEEEDTTAERMIQELQAKKVLLAPWMNLPYRLDIAAETAHTVRILGGVPETKAEEFEQRISENREIRTDLERISTVNGVTSFAATVWKTDRTRFEEIATASGWTTVVLPPLEGTPAAIYEDASVEEKRLFKKKAENREERVRISVDLPNLRKVRTFMRWLHDKQAAREALLETFATVTLLGWAPRGSLDALERNLQTVSPAVAVLKIKPDDGEEPPVLLKNAKFITPFQSVTTLYGFPLPSEMDPTAALSPFFALYFALCLTDGGYGLVLALIFGIYLWKSRKTVEEAQLPWLLFISGVASVLIGIPFGGWFGLTPQQVPEFLTVVRADGSRWFLGQVWNLSTQDGISFLQNLSLVLGIVHIFFGVFLAGWHKFVHGARAEAFWQHFTLHLLLGAALFKGFAPADMQQTATYVLYAAVAITIWGKGYGTVWYLRPLMGFLGLVNFAIGLLSNGLSYLRLLALGLVTGAIALAVNQVAIEMSRLFPIWLGIPVMILIAFGGHLVSIALNALGSFIHSGRLQFIEFFGQFFEGGGRPFTPYRRTLS